MENKDQASHRVTHEGGCHCGAVSWSVMASNTPTGTKYLSTIINFQITLLYKLGDILISIIHLSLCLYKLMNMKLSFIIICIVFLHWIDF